jgi:lia operon protein LiaG
MKKSSKFLSLSIILIIGCLSFSYAQVKVIVDVNKTFSNIQRVEVSGGFLEVEYIGSNRSDMDVSAFLESNYSNQDIVFVTMGNVLKISHKIGQGNWSNTRSKGHIKISGPSSVEVDIKGSSGSIKAENITSTETHLTVSSGSLKAANITGNLFANASSGSITMSNIQGNISGKVSSGSAKISQVKGSVEYASSSGGIQLNDIEGKVNLRLTSGNAQLSNVSSLGDVVLTSGNLKATKVGLSPDTRISGTSGNFTIQTYSNLQDFNYNMRASSGNITIGGSRGGKNMIINNGSAYEVRGSISSGNISITN